MTSNAPIAVIVTCFNLGRTLHAALASVDRQTLRPAELLIVDDGSDNLFTRDVLHSLRRAGRVILDQPHGGVSAARNAGVRATTSPFVVLLDGDDTLEPTYLEKAAARLEADPTLAFVGCGMRSFGELDSDWFPPNPDLVGSLCRGVVPVCSMFRRELWVAVGGFDSSLDGLEDTDFWVSALALGFRGDVLPEVLMHYRVRAGSLHDRTIASGVHDALFARICEKHRAALEPHALRMVLEREAFITEQQSHLDALAERRAVRLGELHALREDVRELHGARLQQGEPVIDFGELARTDPFSKVWGIDRGLPVDRHFIHAFLQVHRTDIRGAVLEVKDSGYTRMFGEGVTRSDVLDIDPSNASATVVADLAAADSIPSDTYDCFILTQTLGLVAEPAAAVEHALRILRPGGVLLCTLPAAGRLSPEGPGRDGDYWRFTEASVRALFASRVPAGHAEIQGFGNVLALTAFNYGLAAHEIPPAQLDAQDPDYPLVYCVRVVKPLPHAVPRAGRRTSRLAILMYHRVTEPAAGRGGITPTMLRAHLDALRNAAVEFVPLNAIPERLASAPDSPAVAITIDDGYRDTLKVAAPILVEFGVPATAFVTAGALEPGFEFPWDRLDALLGQIPPRASIEVRLDGVETALAWDSAAAQAGTTQILLNVVSSSGPDVIDRLLADLGVLAGAAPPAMSDTLTQDELAELALVPRVAIGAHGVDHLWLPAQTTPVRFTEVWGSRERLQRALGRNVDAFAYPYGGFDPATRALVEASGFRIAVTTDARCCARDDSPLLLPRFDAATMTPQDVARLTSR